MTKRQSTPLGRNPNNCSTCEHKRHPDGGHCYLFKDAPTEICMQHTLRQKADATLGEWLASEDFYDLCQQYRHAPDFLHQPKDRLNASQAFEVLKDMIRQPRQLHDEGENMTCTRHGGNDDGMVLCKFCDAEIVEKNAPSPLATHGEVCKEIVYPCGPKLRSKYFPYTRNCLRPADGTGYCFWHRIKHNVQGYAYEN